MRAEVETLSAQRTWFFTGTFAKQSHDYDEVSEDVTLFLKRLRDRCFRSDPRTNYRYLIVPERHKSGAWHFHALFHGDSNLTARMIEDSWQYGFTDIQLADVNTAGYVTKYATKDLFSESSERRPRIRASRAPTYGGWIIERDARIVEELIKMKPEGDLPGVWQKNLKQIVKEMRRQKTRPKGARYLAELTSIPISEPKNNGEKKTDNGK